MSPGALKTLGSRKISRTSLPSSSLHSLFGAGIVFAIVNGCKCRWGCDVVGVVGGGEECQRCP